MLRKAYKIIGTDFYLYGLQKDMSYILCVYHFAIKKLNA